MSAVLRQPIEIARRFVPGMNRDADVRTVYQPIVDLYGGGVVGYEALTRGPAGTAFESPVRLFDAARGAGLLADFDRACRNAALERARWAGILPPLAVFLNVEPGVVEQPQPARLDPTWVNAPSELRCCIEITERDLTHRPAELLFAVSEIRELGWGVALDDVGADNRSLALMPLLRPDVIKLDLRLIHDRPSVDIAEVVNAVAAEAESSGSAVVAEGIETDEHLETALALGARFGQGYRFGRPVSPPETIGRPVELRFLGQGATMGSPTPVQIVQATQMLRRAGQHLLQPISQHIERQAMVQPGSTVLLAVHPEAGELERYAGLAGGLALLGAFGPDAHPGAGALRGSSLGKGDALALEWDLVVVGPHVAAAMVARRLGPNRNGDSEFEFAVTHDRQLVIECARSLIARVPPLQSEPWTAPAGSLTAEHMASG